MDLLIVAQAADPTTPGMKALMLIIGALIALAILLAILRKISKWFMNLIPPVLALALVVYFFIAPLPASAYPAATEWAFPLVQQYRNLVDTFWTWLQGQSRDAGRL